MARETRIWTDVDYDKAGKQIGSLYLHHSVTRSAYGNIMIPVTAVKNGSGPTVFLMAGNHGDEYEGQVALAKFIQSVQPGEVNGRIIIVPAANLPAALDGARVSPIDEGNMNRAFPGDPDGSATQQIAHYISTVLFPMANYFQDYHSGGGSLDYLPFASMQTSGKPELDAKALAALTAVGAPRSMIWVQELDTRLAGVDAHRQGVISLAGEFGGTGNVARGGVKLVERCIRRLLTHAGVMAADPNDNGERVTRFLTIPNREMFVYAPDGGLFEPFADLGDEVRAGQPCGQIHFVDNPARPPVPCHFRADGFVMCKRHPGRVERGDCVAHLAIEGKPTLN